jgi:hypothetical protein
MKKTVKFTMISQNECKFEFKGKKFILAEHNVGVFGLGRCVNIYELNEVTKKYVKTVGWTRSDNHGGPDKDCITSSIITFEACKQLALVYLENLLS